MFVGVEFLWAVLCLTSYCLFWLRKLILVPKYGDERNLTIQNCWKVRTLLERLGRETFEALGEILRNTEKYWRN